ncbi:hypothetical protein NW754_005713 [Fusarium falciforme]|nr:hypothetical protein NW754_005713 [Fusarium falciforme]
METGGKQVKSSEARPAGVELAAVLPNDGIPWYKHKHLVKVNFCVMSLMLFSGSNGFYGSLMNSLLALPWWRDFMDNPTGAWLGFINAAYALGCAIGYPIAAYVSNRWGRKLPVWISVLFSFIGVAMQTAAQNQATFIIARFFQGLSQGFTLSVSLLIAENAYPTHRGVCSAIYNCGCHFGSVIAAWATFGTRNYTEWSWRLPSLLQILLPILGVPGLIMIPESPRWLVCKDRSDEARQNLANPHTGGDAEMEAEKNPWTDLWATPGNRHRLLITLSLGTFAQWTGNGVVSYYLDAIQWKYYFVFLATIIIMIFVVWFYYPEARGLTLENVALLVDGDSTHVGVATAENAIKSSYIKHKRIEEPQT